MRGSMNHHTIRAAAVTALFASAACGSGGRDVPTAVPTPVVPAATPIPAPSATPQAFRCPLPAMPDLHNVCPKLSPQILDRVNAGLDATIRQHPELFDFDDTLGGNPRVLDRQKYVTAVVDAINAQGGVCAKDDNEEIAVKVTNDYHEQYNIWTSSGYLRRSYITTCFPAQF